MNPTPHHMLPVWEVEWSSLKFRLKLDDKNTSWILINDGAICDCERKCIYLLSSYADENTFQVSAEQITYKRIWNILFHIKVMPFNNSYLVAKSY